MLVHNMFLCHTFGQVFSEELFVKVVMELRMSGPDIAVEHIYYRMRKADAGLHEFHVDQFCSGVVG